MELFSSFVISGSLRVTLNYGLLIFQCWHCVVVLRKVQMQLVFETKTVLSQNRDEEIKANRENISDEFYVYAIVTAYFY